MLHYHEGEMVNQRRYFRADGEMYKRYKVLLELYRFVQTKKTVPSIRTLALVCKMPKGTMEAHLHRLQAEGLVDWVEGRLALIDSNWDPPEEFSEFIA